MRRKARTTTRERLIHAVAPDHARGQAHHESQRGRGELALLRARPAAPEFEDTPKRFFDWYLHALARRFPVLPPTPRAHRTSSVEDEHLKGWPVQGCSLAGREQPVATATVLSMRGCCTDRPCSGH
jgi:hypothetical protein